MTTYTRCEAVDCRETVDADQPRPALCRDHYVAAMEGKYVPMRPRWDPSQQPGVDFQTEHDRRRGYAPGQRGHLP